MFRVVLTPILLLAVLIQAVFGCFWRHSHEPAPRADAKTTVSAVHSHHHGHEHGYHHHGGRDHAPSAAGHFHFGGESDEQHDHERSGDDTYSYLVTRGVAVPSIDVTCFGYVSPVAVGCVRVSAEPSGWRERFDAYGRSGWPSGQRLSLLGVWLI